MSFVSPCVLPLVPAYLSFLAGVTFEEATNAGEIPTIARLVTAAAAFVFGFTLVFVILGASATLLGRALADHFTFLARLSGLVVILFGIHYMGLLNVRFLNYEARFHGFTTRAGAVGAFVVGLAFAFGWTPCVGPVLATVLLVAGRSATVGHGILLLTFYGLGLGIPFLIAAAALGSFVRIAAAMRRWMRWVEVASGTVMVATGSFILAGSLAGVSAWLLRVFPILSRIG